MEEVVIFKNAKGVNLFGIVHIPEKIISDQKRTGVNFLNPGIKYRVAPNRLNVKLARKLCEKGYYVFRFDPMGIGDSEGELPDNFFVADIWEKIQTGLFVQDTLRANDVFINEYNIENLILAGNCGGAITSLLAAEKDKRINNLVLIDVPIDLRTVKHTFANKVVYGGKKADWLFSEYLKRVFRLKSWLRFFSLQSNYKAFLKVVEMKFVKMFTFNQDSQAGFENFVTLCQTHGLNTLFFHAFESFMSRKKPILFILAENDKGTEIFIKYFQEIYLKNMNSYNQYVDTFIVKNANHIYSLYEWQESLSDSLLEWIYKWNDS